MKHRLYSIGAVLALCITGILSAGEPDPLQFQAHRIIRALEQQFPSLTVNVPLQQEYEQQVRFQLLKGFTYQEALAQLRQELAFKFGGSDVNESEQQRRLQSLRMLRTAKGEQSIFSGAPGKGSPGSNAFTFPSQEKPGSPHR
ncbi:MAG: hypothetical protein ACOZCE_12480 [Spirochaetota bacterium]|jgi:hypothetical protein|uniref:hypothetical protein n=1 Tax=Gracilinema caldarium TaxID=215591 RepID=UPI0026EF50FD|nr:hypothetical protein [Gracilinema caldarium]HRS04461.1 hypothetical protein [Treponema sp.]